MIGSSLLAYIGPGAGMGLMGALIGLGLALVSAVGFVLAWPVRNAIRKMRANRSIDKTT